MQCISSENRRNQGAAGKCDDPNDRRRIRRRGLMPTAGSQFYSGFNSDLANRSRILPIDVCRRIDCMMIAAPVDILDLIRVLAELNDKIPCHREHETVCVVEITSLIKSRPQHRRKK